MTNKKAYSRSKVRKHSVRERALESRVVHLLLDVADEGVSERGLARVRAPYHVHVAPAGLANHRPGQVIHPLPCKLQAQRLAIRNPKYRLPLATMGRTARVVSCRVVCAYGAMSISVNLSQI